MSFGFLGIQFGFALQNANTSRIFETLGAEVDDIPILWIAAPVTGLFVQPVIGYFSDKTWGRLGRRRPYFLVGAILASISLFIMPNSPALWIAAGMLWIMDASINISMEPFRAFVGDLLPTEQRNKGFAMQSFFIGTGAVVASALPYILSNLLGIPNNAPEGEVGLSVKLSFYIGGVVFFLTVLYTIFKTKEYPPEDMEAFEAYEKAQEQAHTGIDGTQKLVPTKKFFTNGVLFTLIGAGLAYWLYTLFLQEEVKGEVMILAFCLVLFGIIQLISGLLVSAGKSENGFVEIINDLLTMPKTMAQLAVVQFFSWFALFSMWIYCTPSVAQTVFGATPGNTQSPEYQNAGDWVGLGFAVYNGVAALIAFGLPPLAKKIGRKQVHMVCLIAGGIGLASIYLFPGKYSFLIGSMAGVGIAWASILSMPYAMLSDALPANKMGIYMGIFNFFIVLPQITAASILGFLVAKPFSGQPVYALLTGGASMILAAVLVLIVKDKGK